MTRGYAQITCSNAAEWGAEYGRFEEDDWHSNYARRKKKEIERRIKHSISIDFEAKRFVGIYGEDVLTNFIEETCVVEIPYYDMDSDDLDAYLYFMGKDD